MSAKRPKVYEDARSSRPIPPTWNERTRPRERAASQPTGGDIISLSCTSNEETILADSSSS